MQTACKAQILKILNDCRSYVLYRFRWVYCQLEYLWGCHPGRIRHVLTELPETLDATYERILREINKADWELTHRLFQCVAVASRPLRVEELAEFLAFDFKAGPIPKFQEDWRLEDPVEAVLSKCSTLLALVNVDGSQVIQFSHFSVKEYLTSIRPTEATDKALRQFSISMTSAHTLVAQACLGILLHMDTNITRDSLQTYPLAEYASQHWVDHVRFENVSQSAQDGLKELFNPRKRHLAIWVWICDPRNPAMKSKRTERPPQPKGTPLHFAVVCGLHRIVKFLIVEHSQDVNSRCFENEWTPLHVASTYGYVEVARILIEHGADVTAKAVNGWTPLHEASKRGHIDVAGFLVEHGTDAISRDKGGRTPLHIASAYGHVDLSRFLIEQGTDVTVRDNAGWTPLLAVSTYGYTELACLLVEFGADVSARAKDQRTPLHEASAFGHVGLARILIEQGADASARTNDGRTPLHFASSYGYMDIARILVKHGADTSAQAQDGQSPLHVAASYGNLEITRILVEHAADVTAQAKKGWSPLHSAASCGSVVIARFLIEHGADATTRDHDNETPRDVASKGGHTEFVHFLDKHSPYPYAPAQAKDRRTRSPVSMEERAEKRKEHGASSSSTSRIESGWTPLHVAAAKGDVEGVRALVECGSETMALADDGRTPLHVAVEMGNVEVVRVLADHGSDTTTALAQPTQGNRFFYYIIAFCFFIEIYLRFV
jgi:ankyrin repeat protein